MNRLEKFVIIAILVMAAGIGGILASRHNAPRFEPAPGLAGGFLIDTRSGTVCWGATPESNPSKPPVPLCRSLK